MLVLALLIQPIFSVWAESNTKDFTMNTVDAVKSAGDMVEKGNLDTAEQILTKIPKMNNLTLEIERWFLLGQIAARRGDYDTAIKIFRKILDDQPDLARIRIHLWNLHNDFFYTTGNKINKNTKRFRTITVYVSNILYRFSLLDFIWDIS